MKEERLRALFSRHTCEVSKEEVVESDDGGGEGGNGGGRWHETMFKNLELRDPATALR